MAFVPLVDKLNDYDDKVINYQGKDRKFTHFLFSQIAAKMESHFIWGVKMKIWFIPHNSLITIESWYCIHFIRMA